MENEIQSLRIDKSLCTRQAAMIKTLFIAVFLLIVFSLGSALYHLVNHKSEAPSDKTVKALTFRIALSIVLFIIVFLAIATGILQPQGIGSRMHLKKNPIIENKQNK